MTIKEQLKGTCVLNEKEGMGAEIVALYTEVGINNRYGFEGLDIDFYYGCDRNGDIDCTDEENTIFDKVLTLSQLREIVSTPEIKEAQKEMQDAFVKANPDMKHSEPQFKAGDVIIYETICGSPNGEIKDSAYGTYIQYYKDDRHIIEDQHGFITESNSIRHPKDKIKEKAEELYNKWNLPPYTTTKEIIIEAIKWGQENK